MASSRSPNINYNGSGYLDVTARDAIIKADREQFEYLAYMKLRRTV